MSDMLWLQMTEPKTWLNACKLTSIVIFLGFCSYICGYYSWWITDYKIERLKDEARLKYIAARELAIEENIPDSLAMQLVLGN